jgi:Protein of unknown function (DUF1688)
MLEAGLRSELSHFQVDMARLEPAAGFVAGVIRQNYPDLKVPLHARWRHFVSGGRDLWAEIDNETVWPSAEARARSAFDLAIISVLLDAGAGPDWSYRDDATGAKIGRSEGLAVATLRMFQAGLFSSDPEFALRADASSLAALTSEHLSRGFQADAGNPLAGIEGRARLIANLGRTVLGNRDVFGMREAPRPGGLFDHLCSPAANRVVAAPAILRALLTHLAPIWPGRIMLGGIALGDTWYHPRIKRSGASNGLVPLHKLSQWLSYSLIEPLLAAGTRVSDIDGLTGLAEYRNGGLFIDAGVIRLRDPDQAFAAHSAGSELVVEWRALTVALLDLIAPLVRQKLEVEPQMFPLACVLEGGTWSAGRLIAKQKRVGGAPPLNIVSDGTVF